MNDLCSGDIDIDEVGKEFAPKFVQTFKSLLTIMENQETKLRMKEAKERSQLNSQSVSSSTSTDAVPPEVASSRTQVFSRYILRTKNSRSTYSSLKPQMERLIHCITG